VSVCPCQCIYASVYLCACVSVCLCVCLCQRVGQVATTNVSHANSLQKALWTLVEQLEVRYDLPDPEFKMRNEQVVPEQRIGKFWWPRCRWAWRLH
jgi:hypothetical protein